MNRLPKHLRIKETGVVYELIATIPPKPFIRQGEYVYRLAQETDPFTGGPVKMTDVEYQEYQKKQKKGPSKWKMKMLELMGFPPDKIKRMTANVVTAQDESKIMQWLEQHSDDVEKASPEQLLKAIQRDLGEDVAEEAAVLLKGASVKTAKDEETTGHQGEKGEGPAECKKWCESHYDRPCNCEEGKPDDRYDKYYASVKKPPGWFTARKQYIYHSGERTDPHSAEVWHLNGLHYIYLRASGEIVQYIIKVEDESQAVAYADEWVAEGSVRPKEHQSFVVAQHPRRPPKPQPLPSGPVRVKHPPPRPKAPLREEEEMMVIDEEEPLRPKRRAPRPPAPPRGPVKVKSPPSRPRMPTAETIQFEKRGPGKFDDNIDATLYDYVLDGWADDSLGDAEGFGAYDLLLFGDEPLVVQYDDGSEDVIRAAVLLIDNQGFVSTDTYDKEEEAREDWEEIEKDYDDFLGEDEEAY